MKNLKQRKGFINRNIDGLPLKRTIIKVITNDSDGEHVDICNWKPFNPKNYAEHQLPSYGYLGTATVVNGQYPGIGFHAWKQNNSEFVYYQIVGNKSKDISTKIKTTRTFTKEEVQWLLKRQIQKCVNVVARMPMPTPHELVAVDNDMAIIKKLRNMKPISVSEIKNLKK